jgi:hypothetical protein
MQYRISRYIAAVIMLFLAFPYSFAAAQTAAPGADATCESLLPADRPQFSGADAPTIQFDRPANGSQFYGTSLGIEVDVNNFEIDSTSGQHWHLWVNGQLQGMVYQPSVTVDLEPGTYHLCASLGNTDHADMGEPASTTITILAAAAGTPTSQPALTSAPGTLIAEPDVTPGQLVLILAAGLIAALGGWWLGSRLPKHHK